jgi:septum site-determining protein MinD
LLEAEGKGAPSLIINRLNPRMIKHYDMLSAEDVLDLLAIRLIGIVPEDESVIIATNRGSPISFESKSKAGQAFRNIARRLKGEEVPFMDLENHGGLLDRLTRLTGRR